MEDKKKKKKITAQALRGTQDILPEKQKYWGRICRALYAIAASYGFERIDTPIIESADVFLSSLWQSADAAKKNVYAFRSRGGEAIALRSEGRPGLVRAYIQHGMVNLPQPVKLYYVGPMFRYEHPQHGKYRQFHQFGFEIFGEEEAVADAQIIHIFYLLLRDLGLKNIQIRINSLGHASDQKKYRSVLLQYYRSNTQKICQQCRQRLKTNPFQLLRCQEEKCIQTRNEAPQIIDHLSPECHNHFKEVLEFLEELELPYLLDPYLTRDKDYYSKTVFKIIPEGSESGLKTFVAGGRCDRLIEGMGEKNISATGGAGGVERIIQAMEDANIRIESRTKPHVFLAQLGTLGKRKSLRLFEDLRKAGIPSSESLGKASIKSQLKIAERLGVSISLILGQKEALDGNIIIREMDSGVQETVPMTKVIFEIKRRLKR